MPRCASIRLSFSTSCPHHQTRKYFAYTDAPSLTDRFQVHTKARSRLRGRAQEGGAPPPQLHLRAGGVRQNAQRLSEGVRHRAVKSQRLHRHRTRQVAHAEAEESHAVFTASSGTCHHHESFLPTRCHFGACVACAGTSLVGLDELKRGHSEGGQSRASSAFEKLQRH